MELIHTDLYGPNQTRSYIGDGYFIIFTDDYSRMMWVGFLRKKKSKAFETFKFYKEKVENEIGLKIKCLRLDRGGEFTSHEFNTICEECGIVRKTSTPRTPQQNDVAERRNRIVLDVARTMLLEGKVPHTH